MDLRIAMQSTLNPETAASPSSFKIALVTSGYNATAIEGYYSKRPIEVWERLLDIGSPILGWYIMRKVDNITSIFRDKKDRERVLNLRAKDLKESIVQGKSVTLIKSGQALALRPDIVKSSEYIRELQTLQDEVGTFPNEQAMEIIRAELGVEPTELYDFDPRDPIASASIGQVYKARLRGSDSASASVAVKVQRPDALSTIAVDMYILRKAAAFLKDRYKLRSNLVGIADEFGCQLFNELNYRQEARNCIRFGELYGRIPDIYVPGVYEAYTSQRVLTMEFVEGMKGPWKENGEKMLTVGLQCSVLQLLESGFFHADPHRGNLLMTGDGKLAYLDFGMMAEVPVEQRYALIGTVLGLVNKDISLVIKNMKLLEFFPPETDTEVLVSALSSAVLNATENGQGSTLNFTRLNQNIQSISYLLPVRLPPFYTLIIRTLTILEGLALSVDPSFRLIKGAYPFIAKQILSSPSPALGQLLKQVIVTKDNRIRWDKLEQFISISSSADAAVKGDFQALKAAQDRSDIVKAYSSFGSDSSKTGDGLEGSITYDVVVQIMDFLLSDNGKYLREPLIEELVETLDSLGLSAATLLSLATNGLIPRPKDLPDRGRVQGFLSMVSGVASLAMARWDSSSSSSVDRKGMSLNDIRAGRNNLSSSWESFLSVVNTLNRLVGMEEGNSDGNNDRNGDRVVADSGSGGRRLLDRLSVLASQVVGRIAERAARRAVRDVITPGAVGRAIPSIVRLFDLIPSSTRK